MTTPTYYALFVNPTFLNTRTGKPLPNDTGWQTRHKQAISAPRGFEIPIVEGIAAWAEYADHWRARYEGGVGRDGYADDYWEDWGRALAGLLNCETGRLDCGTLSSFIHDTLRAEGFNPDIPGEKIK